MDEIEVIIKKCENEFDDDSESIVIGDRYLFIGSVVLEVVKKKNKLKENILDKIDKVVINCFLVLLIFVVIMFIVYYVVIIIGI